MSTNAVALDDEFFGSMVDDDHNNYHECYDTRSNPQDEIDSSTSREIEALTRHEVHASEETAFKRGFLEGFDAVKDERLQAGFDEGYRQAIKESMNIGKILGESTVEAAHAFAVDSAMSSTLSEEACRIATAMRFFLEESQQDSNESGDEGIHTRMTELEEKIRQIRGERPSRLAEKD